MLTYTAPKNSLKPYLEVAGALAMLLASEGSPATAEQSVTRLPGANTGPLEHQRP